MSIKNVEDLRDFLALQLERVAKGEVTPASANASANIAGKMLGAVKMELEYNKMVGSSPTIDFLGAPSASKVAALEHIDEETGEVTKVA